MDEIVHLWEILAAATDKKGSKLQEASQQQQFNRTVEDVELWLSEIESQLLSEDYGKVTCLIIKSESRRESTQFKTSIYYETTTKSWDFLVVIRKKHYKVTTVKLNKTNPW